MQNFIILASRYSWADWFESYLVGNPVDRFSHVKAHVWRSSVRSAMHVASQLPGREPTDVDDAPASAC